MGKSPLGRAPSLARTCRFAAAGGRTGTMFRRTRRKSRPLIVLSVAASLCLLGGLFAAAMVGAGALPKSPLLMASIVIGVGLVVLLALLLALEVLARSKQDVLQASVEDLSTLTFPAAPRVQRPVLNRVK